MNLNLQYDFSKASYAEIITCALQNNYLIGSFNKMLNKKEKSLILRHDIDISLEIALEMAIFENSLGVSSTFFVMCTNDFYNIANVNSRKILYDIKKLGHEIGLHWDSRLYRQESAELFYNDFNSEKHFLESIIQEEVLSASQHNPFVSPLINIDDIIKYEAYSTKIKNNWEYVSDSAMRWRQHTPIDLIKKNISIQFNSHPVYWMFSIGTATEKIFEARNLVLKNISNEYDRFVNIMTTALLTRDNYDIEFRNRKNWISI